jgi:UDP-N-acetyl-D-glucosamine dehydrogenase
VSESTSYPGTLRDIIIPTVESLKPKESLNVYFATAPERVNPRDLIWNQKNTPRLIGGIDTASQSKALDFYQSICDVAISVSTPEIAEAAKLLENTFRLVNIALINEFTKLCSTQGINVHEVIDAASSKPYGFMPFRPGIGVGGHCIPVDPLYLTWWARKNGQISKLVEDSAEAVRLMPDYVATRILDLIDKGIPNPRVLIIGVAYKPGVSDVRESPSKLLKDYLVAEGVEVGWIDPLVKNWESTSPVKTDWQCDVVVVALPGVLESVTAFIDRGVKVLDCTNTFMGVNGVHPL